MIAFRFEAAFRWGFKQGRLIDLLESVSELACVRWDRVAGQAEKESYPARTRT